MFTKLHERLGSAGLVVAIVALVAAIAGTAFAAGGGLSGKQKKEVKKIAKQFAGKDGAAGAAGSAGPTGAQGPKGDTGPKGEAGTPGKDGKNGEDGEDGEPGEPGKDGENGACSVANPVCEIPSGATLTGDWGFNTINVAHPAAVISFGLRSPVEPQLRYMDAFAEPTEECPGTYEFPEAKKGFLCFYVNGFETINVKAASTNHARGDADAHSGVIVTLAPENIAEEAIGRGSWAVTAP